MNMIQINISLTDIFNFWLPQKLLSSVLSSQMYWEAQIRPHSGAIAAWEEQ